MSELFFHRNSERNLFDTPKEVKTPYLLSLLLVSFTALLALIMYSKFPPIVPLFYSLSEHKQQLTQSEWLLFIPAFSFLVFITNVGLIKVLKTLDITFIQIIAWITTAMLGLMAFSLIRIWIIL